MPLALALFVTAGWYKAGLRQGVVFFRYVDATALLAIIVGLCVLVRLRSNRPLARWCIHLDHYDLKKEVSKP